MKIVLIGDSIRIGYQPLVAQKLQGKADVWGPAENSRHSLWVLDHFQEWIADRKPDIVHFNCGIHDTVIMEDGKLQVVMEQYRLCMQRIVRRLTDLPQTKAIWAASTPWYTGQAGTPLSLWSPRPEIDEYNAAALVPVKTAGLAVNDLNRAVHDNDYTKCLNPEDGLHMTDFGNEVLSDAVVGAVITCM